MFCHASVLDFDSWGKPGSGILSGNGKWFGAFDQCIGIPDAKYCLVSVLGKFRTNTVILYTAFIRLNHYDMAKNYEHNYSTSLLFCISPCINPLKYMMHILQTSEV